MEKINIIAKRTLNLKQMLLNIPFEKIIICILAFFIGRVAIFNDLYSLGIAYYALLIKKRFLRIGGGILTIAALLTVNFDVSVIKYIIIIAVLAGIGVLIEKRKIKITVFGQALITAICVLIISSVEAVLESFSIYLFMVSFLESIFIFIMVYIYSKCFNVFENKANRTVYSEEEIIGLTILIGSAIAGISDISFSGIYLLQVISYFLVLYCGYAYGISIGAVVGLTLGLFINLTGNAELSIIAILGSAGLMSGLFKELGKMGSIVGFLVGTLLMRLHINPNINIYIEIRSIIISIIMLIIIPQKYLTGSKNRIKKKTMLDQNEYLRRIQDIISDKLKLFSETFDHLAETFNNISEKRTNLTQHEISTLLDEVAQRVCCNCNLSKHCWESDFYYTYQTVFSILNVAELKGKIEKKDIPLQFFNQCNKAEEFIKVTNRIYEIYKLNLSWYNKMIESRSLVTEQLKGISKIINSLSEDVYREIRFDTVLEHEITAELERLNINLHGVVVLEDKKGNYEVNLIFDSFREINDFIKNITKGVSKILNRNMKISNNVYYPKIKNRYYNLKLIEQKTYKVMTATANVAKNHLSGDNYTNIELNDGKYLIALSDGMGTGYKANKESTTTIELLERLMESGFEKDTAIKMINSLLLLKSNEETFSTLDMSIIDLYSGVCEFVKIGGATIFVKKKNKIETIKSTTLPVGILDKIDLEVYTLKLNHGDIIVMVTDGVIDIGDNCYETEKWIKNIILNIDSNNPKYIADYILEKIKEREKNNLKDDMTILVSRIWKER